MGDRIVLTGIRLEGRHGVGAEERSRPQPFEVTIECAVDARAAAERDALDATLDYRALRAVAAGVVGGPPRALVETLADTIAERIVTEVRAEWARVRVTKLEPPHFGGPASVEVERRRGASVRTTTLVELHVPDFAPVRAFYGRLGFAARREEPDTGSGGYLVLARGENVLSFWPGSERVEGHAYFGRFPPDSPRGYGVEVVLVVDDLDAVYETACAMGAVVSELRDRPWGARDFRAADPFGYYLRFTEAVMR